MTAASRATVPDGFETVPDHSGFLEHYGPVWLDRGRQVLALRVAPHHLNAFARLHGGALAAFTDLQLLLLRAIGCVEFANAQTVTLSTDMLAPVSDGDWLEMTASVTAQTGAMLFTDAVLCVGDRVVARARAIYRRPRAAAPDNVHPSAA